MDIEKNLINLYYVDEFGKPVERTKFDFPYSYDGFVTYRAGNNSEITGTVYSDRLSESDYEKIIC